MRLFIGITFSDAEKEQIVEVMRRLRENSLQGRYTLRDNLHLTLAFLGEVPLKYLVLLKSAIDSSCKRAFSMRLCGIGHFRDVYWMGADAPQTLYEMQAALVTTLRSKGFAAEEREYQPHLTLIRQAMSYHDLPGGLPEIPVQVRSVSLIASERINGQMRYREIYRKQLEEETE